MIFDESVTQMTDATVYSTVLINRFLVKLFKVFAICGVYKKLKWSYSYKTIVIEFESAADGAPGITKKLYFGSRL